MEMNQTIKLLQSHRSIRKFKPDPIPEPMLEMIVRSAQWASSSSHVQAYSVIAVTDRELKEKLSIVAANQTYVAECPVFLVWCADLRRSQIVCEIEKVEMVHDTMENFIVATVDTALAAQNAAIAAESLGLGIVYIGSLRNDLREVTRLLNIPKLVYPVFGMCLGYPDQEPTQRPRLPLEAVLHRNTYSDREMVQAIQSYDETMRVLFATDQGIPGYDLVEGDGEQIQAARARLYAPIS